MRQELIDLLLGELEGAEAEALKARLRTEPGLRRELVEIEALFGLMRRGEEIEPLPATRALVLEAAARVRPPLLARLRALPGLVAFRFRASRGFRIAAFSLAAHAVLLAVLAQVLLKPAEPVARPHDTELGAVPADQERIEPARPFQRMLAQRRLPQSNRLRQVGVDGQEEAIAAGLNTLVARQRPDGSFGDSVETGYAALALLAQGECSTEPTPRGRAVGAAIARLLEAAGRGEANGAMLTALVEDFSFSYEKLDDFERETYRIAIRKLMLAVGDDDASREGLLVAHLAGFALPAGRQVGEAQLLSGNRATLLAMEPSRLRATVVFARCSRVPLDPERARAWAQPLFEQAMAELKGGNASALVLLTLESPYRL